MMVMVVGRTRPRQVRRCADLCGAVRGLRRGCPALHRHRVGPLPCPPPQIHSWVTNARDTRHTLHTTHAARHDTTRSAHAQHVLGAGIPWAGRSRRSRPSNARRRGPAWCSRVPPSRGAPTSTRSLCTPPGEPADSTLAPIFLQQPTRRTRTHTIFHRRIAQISLVGDPNAGREAHRPQHAVHRPGPGYLAVNYILYIYYNIY